MKTGYESTWAYLADEWARLDLMIRMHLIQQQAPAADDPSLDPFRGLVVSEQEVQRLLDEPDSSWEGDPEWQTAQRELVALERVIAERVEVSQAASVSLPLLDLCARFALTELERQCLLVCLAVEADRKYEKLFAFLHDDVTMKQPTVDLVFKLLRLSPDESLRARAAFAPGGRLSTYFLKKEESAEKQQTLLARALKLDDRIVRYAFGDGEPDEALARLTERHGPADELPELIWEAGVQEQMRQFLAASHLRGGESHVLFLLHGQPGAGKELHVRHLCHHLGRNLLVFDVRRAKQTDAALPNLLRQTVREAILQRAVLCFRHVEELLEDGVPQKAMCQLTEALADLDDAVFLLSERPWRMAAENGRHLVVEVPLSVPPDPVRRGVWERLAPRYGVGGEVDWGALAGKFRYSVGQIERSLERAAFASTWRSAAGRERAEIDLVTLHEACYGQVSHRLEKKATRITPKYDWERLILPQEQKEQLINACNQMKYRSQVFGEWGFDKKLSYGKGLSMLFAGPPGTGKTMSAEVIAKDLHLEIYKIDLSQVISKYIGETEKNLHEIFAEAQLSSAILFFDEADALFGKRSEVNDSHDKYANVETAYLLQKMEEYQGITILATNFQQNIDEAFMRRINYVVKFPFPDAAYREQIWRGMFPKETPLDEDVDFAWLAERFEMAGGNIKNVVLSAAFLAADAGTSVRMRHLLSAVRHELQKAGKILLKGDWAEYFEE